MAVCVCESHVCFQVVTGSYNTQIKSFNRCIDCATELMDRHTDWQCFKCISLALLFTHSLSFSSISLSQSNTLLSMLDFHTIAVTECVNWEKCVNKWLIFRPSLLYFYFLPASPCHPHGIFLNFIRHRWSQLGIRKLFACKSTMASTQRWNRFYAGECLLYTESSFIQIFSLIGILFPKNKYTKVV